MSLQDVICLLMIFFGVILFLYGANSYSSLFGWVGVYLMIGGLVLRLTLLIWMSLKRRNDGDQNP